MSWCSVSASEPAPVGAGCRSSCRFARSAPAASLLVLLHPVAYDGGVERARMTKGPSKRSSSYGKVQAAGRGVQVRSTARSPMVRVWYHRRSGALALHRQADQVGCARPLAAADAGAHRPDVPTQALPRCGAVGGVDGGDGALQISGASTGGVGRRAAHQLKSSGWERMRLPTFCGVSQSSPRRTWRRHAGPRRGPAGGGAGPRGGLAPRSAGTRP